MPARCIQMSSVTDRWCILDLHYIHIKLFVRGYVENTEYQLNQFAAGFRVNHLNMNLHILRFAAGVQ